MRVELRDGGDLKRLVRDLRQLDRQAAKELTSEFRGVRRPIVADVRAMYRALPAASRRRRPGRPLRSALASATRGQVRTGGMRQAGIRVAASGRRMPPGMGSLPSMVEGPPEGKVWRHPVHGDRQVWVT